jgi:hypothetical protein
MCHQSSQDMAGSQNFPVRIATIIALPHAAFLGDDANRGYAPDRPKRRRPDLDVDPVLEADGVGRDATMPAAQLLH